MANFRSLERNTRDGPQEVAALAKWRILNRLHDRNETLFYKVSATKNDLNLCTGKFLSEMHMLVSNKLKQIIFWVVRIGKKFGAKVRTRVIISRWEPCFTTIVLYLLNRSVTYGYVIVQYHFILFFFYMAHRLKSNITNL